MTDPYLDRCIHGMLPLCREAGSGKLRFARIGVDSLEDCLTDVADLPDAELTLIAFETADEMVAWSDGARQFSGNAADIILPQSHASLTPCILMVRFDRSRRAGQTLEEVIELRTDLLHGSSLRPPALKRFAHGREEISGKTRAASQRDAWKTAWAAEIAFAAEFKLPLGHQTYHQDIDASSPLHLELRKPSEMTGPNIKIERVNDGITASIQEIRWPLEDDLLAERKALLDRLGFVAGNGCVVMAGTQLDMDFIERFKGSYAELQRETNRIHTKHSARSAVKAAKADDRGLAMLKRVYRGAFVSAYRMGDPGYQINPATGTPATVPGTHIRNAFSRGLLDIAYPGDDHRQSTPGEKRLRIPIILTLSETGKALVEDRLGDAALTITDAAERAKSLNIREMQRGNLTEALRSAMTQLKPSEADLASAVASKADNYAVTIAAKGNANDQGWAILGPAIGIGAASVHDGYVSFEIEPEISHAPR